MKIFWALVHIASLYALVISALNERPWISIVYAGCLFLSGVLLVVETIDQKKGS